MIVSIRRAIPAIALLLAIAGCVVAKTPADFLKAGDEAMSSENIDAAIDLYTKGTEAVGDASEDPSDMVDLEVALGNAYSAKGEKEARNHWEKAIELIGGAKRRFREKLTVKKAEVLYKFGNAIREEDTGKSIQYLSEAGSLVPGYWQTWVKLGRICEDIYDMQKDQITELKGSIKQLTKSEKELLEKHDIPDLDLKGIIKQQEKQLKQLMKGAFIFNERALKSLIKGYGILKTMDKEEIVDYPEDIEKTMSRIQLAIGRGAVKTGQKNCAEAIGGAEEKVYCKALAIQAYKMAIEHDPTNKEAQEFLDVMGDDESKNIVEKDYVKKMLNAFKEKREESYKAGRDEL